MNDLPIQKTVCHACCAVLDATDRYCRHCGAPTGKPPHSSGNRYAAVPAAVTGATPVMATLAAGPALRPAKPSESPWIVLPMLFLVLGPVGLPMLWRSREFSLFWKCILTAVMVAVTALLLWGIWWVTHQTMMSLQELDKLR